MILNIRVVKTSFHYLMKKSIFSSAFMKVWLLSLSLRSLSFKSSFFSLFLLQPFPVNATLPFHDFDLIFTS
jgi:hypothetical protein